MRLKRVFISHYKNLRDFTLNFDGDSFIDMFVGKNGTGKSNLFEALAEIFRHIVEYDRNRASCDMTMPSPSKSMVRKHLSAPYPAC
jgi:recombinational DNA repair ATPase RecF